MRRALTPFIADVPSPRPHARNAKQTQKGPTELMAIAQLISESAHLCKNELCH